MLNKQKIKNFIANLTQEEGILCDTEKYADEILKIANGLGYKWSSRDTTSNNWGVYKERTCYYFNPEGNKILYDSKEYAEQEKLIFHTLDVFKSVALAKLMNTVEQIKTRSKTTNTIGMLTRCKLQKNKKLNLLRTDN